jgi:hypothetical protein
MREEKWNKHALLEHFKQVTFEHHPYSPDLAPSDYNLFLQETFSDLSPRNDQETEDSVREIFRSTHTEAGPTILQVLTLYGGYVE